MSSPNYDHLAHLRIPLQYIISAINNFAEENFIGIGGFGYQYEGKLWWFGELIDIHVQDWSNKEWNDEREQEFWMEISMLSTLKHKNVVSLVGFCDENDKKIIVTKREIGGSLNNFLSDSMLLTWVRRLEICLGLAHALSYIHYEEERDFSVIHRNIESGTVLINDTWEPKLSEFRLSMKIEASQRHLSFDTDKVSNMRGYTDPTYLETKSAHHKSDIYSFGIVMFELLCGRRAVMGDDHDNKYLASMVIAHYREKKLNEIIDWDLWNQMGSQSCDIFAEIAYACLDEERLERPNIDEIVTRLEKALELQLEHHTAVMSSRMDSHLKIHLESILSATNNFDQKNVVSRGGYENGYKGQLSWFDELIEITARRYNKDRDEMFWTEVSMLSSLKHQNLVSFVGFCYENGEKIIITRREIKGSLSKYLSDATLTWVQRLKISVGLAHALSYIHYDEARDSSVIHGDISSSTVLLSDNLDPRLSSFEKSVKIEESQRHGSFHTSRVWLREGYTDPTYHKTKSLNHKTDMYAFGIILFELLCGRKSIIADDTNKYLAPAAILLYKEKKLNEIVDWDLWNQMDSQSVDIFAEIAYDCLNADQSQRPNIDEIVPRLQKALEFALENTPIMSSPGDFAHLKIPFKDILSATNNFSEENRIGQSNMLKHYRGEILWSDELIKIDARRLNKERDDEFEQQFWMEISMLSSLGHKNVASLVGFCDENDEKIIIMRHETRGSLTHYLSDSMLLTWVRRLEICVGIAQGLSCIHYDEQRDFSVIHRHIDSGSVLLNDIWEPKLSEFRLSIKIKASQRQKSFHTNKPKYVYAYGDVTYLETKSMSHKSDMYLFGIVLFQLMCGKNSLNSDKHLDPLAITRYRKESLTNLIDPDLRKQANYYSFKMFEEITHECLDKERSRRPNIDDIVPRLEKALELARENRRIHSLPNHLGLLEIPIEKIRSATNYLADKNVIGTWRFGKIYKGQLSWSSELINIIAWKITNKEWNEVEQEFWTQISMLSSLKHKNVVSIVGFCIEVGVESIVCKSERMGRLLGYLSDPVSLTWEKRLKVAMGVAHALSYIHYDESREFSVIHCNISSYTIDLNNDWEPKLCGFENSMMIKESERNHDFYNDSILCIKGYADPTFIKTGCVSHKLDIYSFGIVLFELLCGRESTIDGDINKYLSLVAIFHYRERKLDDIVEPGLWKQMDPQSCNVFADIAYECLNEERSQRPNIQDIVTRLEKALQLQLKSQNRPDSSVVAAKVEGTSSGQEEEGSTVSSISTGVESHVSEKPVSPLKDLSHLKLSFEDIESATNGFTRNFIRHFRFGTIYKGRLLQSGQLNDLTVKRFHSENVYESRKNLWAEISLVTSLKHKNLVSFIGYCESSEVNNMIIYKEEVNGSLERYLSDKTLTWMQRLKICVGVANALSYIHYDGGRAISVIHCNIRSSEILLDDKWEPKLSGFEFSLINTVARRHDLLLTRDIPENEYLDPKYKKTGGVTHKSDVYSFGVVLFEVMCGRSAYPRAEILVGIIDGLLVKLAKSNLDDMIDPHFRKQMDQEAFKIFSETAYWCIEEERAKRPYIQQVVKRLEKALEHQWKHENPVVYTSSNRLKEMVNFEHLRIGLDLINVATNNFDDAYCIGSGGFGKVYKADLQHFDSSNLSSIEGVNICDLPTKRSTVAIKRIHNQQGEQGFIAEIETLATCKHDNIISLLGFCFEGDGVMILVYEHASKGSLQDYLGSSDKMTNLTWVQRVKICLDIAQGLNYIHSNTDHDKQKMIHRDIKSDNILLGDHWEAKIADFGLSKFHPANQTASTIYTNIIAGTHTYLDPEYQKEGKLSKKSDIYSFGVVLLEILTGRLAYDSMYTTVNEKGIAPIARNHFKKGTIMKIVDHKIKEEIDEHIFSLSKGPNKESLDIFLEIAFQCVAETQVERPTIDVVIKELQKALNFQETHKDNLRLSLEDVKLSTQHLSHDNIIGHGNFGNVYRGIVTHAQGPKYIAAKRFDKMTNSSDEKIAEGDAQFVTELKILMEYKHENVIGLVGYCDEEEEKVIVYEYASRGSLDKYLSDDKLTWVMRLKICINIAIGLEFLHRTLSSPEMVIHRDIKSSNILLFDNWEAKISDFGLSVVCPTNQDVGYVIHNVTGTNGYRDPLQSKSGFLTRESDIFSLGAVLFDVLCGKLSSIEIDDEYLYLPLLAIQHYYVGKLHELVFEGIKEQIVPQSYTTFTRIALQCLHHKGEKRPKAHEVIIELKKALEFQEDYDKWEPKLPKDYTEIIQMSKYPENYSIMKKEDLYNIFCDGILLKEDKVLLSFVGDGERNEMVSATMFSYINSCPHDRKSLTKSRFGEVVEISDISNLNIEIKTKAQFLSPNVVYGVYLVFKFCDSRNFSSKPVYVNLKYTMGDESLNAYFATWRDNEWMTIELHQFLNTPEEVVSEFILESFSSYCGDSAIYVEGVEFRAIENVKHDNIRRFNEVPQVLKSKFSLGQLQQLPTKFKEIFTKYRNDDDLFWLGNVNGKNFLMLSAKAAIYKFSNVNLYSSRRSAHCRFKRVLELLPQRVFHINCTIESRSLSPDTEYVCHLLFKLSENCQGMHCPVKVRDVLRQENNEAEFLYFITPSLLNINDITRVPKQREDGWMEIQLWKFSLSHEFKDDSLSMNMKFTSHEGTMSGLIICGLEFRPL